MGRGISVLVLLLGLPLAGSGSAHARVPPELQRGIAAYNNVEYAAALTHLRAALRRTRSREILARTYFYLGCTHLAREERSRAREAFETLLSFAPAYVPSRQLTSPKIASFFAEVRRQYRTPAGPPTMAHQQPRPSEVTGPLTPLTLEVHNLAPRLRPVLRYRPAATPGYRTLEAAEHRKGRFVFAVPTPAGELLYTFALVTRDGVLIQQLRSGARPFRLRPGREEERAVGTPWYRSWWFWTAAGAVALGTGLGVGLGLGLSGGETSRAQVTVLRRDDAGNSVPIFGP